LFPCAAKIGIKRAEVVMTDLAKAISPVGQKALEDLARALRLAPEALAADPVGGTLSGLIIHRDGIDFDRDDPVREITARLGDRWSSLLMFALEAGTMGHAKLRRVICAISHEKQISQRMLTLRLRALERDGLVSRKVTPLVPPRVDYALTPLGHALMGHLRGLILWIEGNQAEILTNRARFEAEEARKGKGW
jgi:DNA-binding HxlR family transcriptional regulator